MEQAIMIRSEIRKCMQEQGFTLGGFSKVTEIRGSYLSLLLNHDPHKYPLPLRHFDRMTQTLGKPEGWLYEYYVEECFITGKADRRRVEPFLLRCAELGKTDCIKQVLSQLIENLSYLPLVFEIAERVHAGGNPQRAVPFYECVAEHEKYQHSETLAISQYRLFRAALGQDLQKNRFAATRFAPFRNRLPLHFQLDGLLQLANTYYTLSDWKRLGEYADELIALAKVVYQEQHQRKTSKRETALLNTERHLVVYYGKGYLHKAISFEKQGLYAESKKYIEGYADLSWFEGLDEVGKHDVQMFQMFAVANLYTIEILMGHNHVLSDYTDYLSKHKLEVLPGLATILESANRYGFPVDDTLERLSEEISEFNQQDDLASLGWRLQFHYYSSIYFLKQDKVNVSIANALQSLELSVIINNSSAFAQIVALFEFCRDKATDTQLNDYKSLLEEVRKYEKFTIGRLNHELI
ncbi:DNA-binding protein [Paenibacillus peoriae]|uniref:DNA-binding protein n=1 Tax=Paenibacillus peoriae TaxID=59893 RepID=UPI003F951CCC